MNPIFNDQTDLAEVISSATKQVIANAKALGIAWTIRIATVVNSGPDSITGIMDGDTTPIGLTNMSGVDVRAGVRVYVIITPPSGNFIVGAPVPADLRLGYGCATAQSMTSGSTTSAVFVDQPGSPSIAVTKKYDSTNLKFSWAQTYFTTGGDINALFGVITSTGDQVFLAKNFVATTAGFRIPISGVGSVSGIAAGTMTWTGAWAQAGGGAGVLTVNGDCFWSMCIEEYWPTD